jgi:hypothetical protein
MYGWPPPHHPCHVHCDFDHGFSPFFYYLSSDLDNDEDYVTACVD